MVTMRDEFIPGSVTPPDVIRRPTEAVLAALWSRTLSIDPGVAAGPRRSWNCIGR